MRKVRRRFQAQQQPRGGRPDRTGASPSEDEEAFIPPWEMEAEPTHEVPQVPVDPVLVDTNTGMVTDASVDVHVETTVDLGTGTDIDTGLSGYVSEVKHVYRKSTVDRGPISEDKHTYRKATVDKGPLSEDKHIYRKTTVEKGRVSSRKG
ncbi:MAG: hypothetical protein QGG50_05820 [Methanopyri archaeon]|jgi:hypothetical protein|nr:hypothetical protein [Methanopyri archaeon]